MARSASPRHAGGTDSRPIHARRLHFATISVLRVGRFPETSHWSCTNSLPRQIICSSSFFPKVSVSGSFGSGNFYRREVADERPGVRSEGRTELRSEVGACSLELSIKWCHGRREWHRTLRIDFLAARVFAPIPCGLLPGVMAEHGPLEIQGAGPGLQPQGLGGWSRAFLGRSKFCACGAREVSHPVVLPH